MTVRVLMALSLMLLAAPAPAQERPAVELAGGWVALLDEVADHRVAIGGSARWPLTPRVSVGPEVAYYTASGHPRYLMVTGNVAVDLRAPTTGTRAVTPYVVAGVGVFQTRDRFLAGSFTATDAAVTGGVGARVDLSRSIYLAPEIRMGWEPHLRATLALGVRLGG